MSSFPDLMWPMEENTGQTPCAKLGSMMIMMIMMMMKMMIDEESDNDDRFSQGFAWFN